MLAPRVWRAAWELLCLKTQRRESLQARSRLRRLILSERTKRFFLQLIQVFEQVAVRSGYDN